MPLPDGEAAERSYDAALMRRLLGFIRPYRVTALIALVLLLATAALTLVGPVLTQRALDVAVPARDIGMLGRLATLFVAALVLDFILDYAQIGRAHV